MQKSVNINELKIDQKLSEECFALNEIEKKVSRQEKPYFNVLLSDKSGEIRAKIWSEAVVNCEVSTVQVGDIVCISGLVQEYNGKPQIIIETMVECKTMAPEEFLPVTSRDRSKMVDDIEAEIEATTNPFLRKLLKLFWENPVLRDKYVNFPAGMYVHHGYVGGLIEHVWEMMTLSKSFLELYPQLDRDTLFTGIFFHDIGKIEELDIVGAAIVKTNAGNLIAHISQGALLLDRMISENISSFPEALKEKLLHLILAHQGSLQNGSPVVPQTLEALVLSMIDDNGARMNQATKHIEKNLPSGEDFTEYHKWLGTSLYQKDYLAQDGSNS